MTTTIQVQITGDEEYGRWLKVLFCGDPGSGKTLISSTFPNALFASAEGGLMSIARRKIPYVKINETEKLLQILRAMEQPPSVRPKMLGMDDTMERIDTVVIDTIDEIARLLVRERLEAQKKETMAIADWGWLGDQLRAIIRAFRNLDMHVVFTCHLKSTEDSESGRVFFKPAIQGAVGDEIAGYVDLALLLRAQPMARVVDGESKRVMVRYLKTMPDPSFPWIKDRSGTLPEDFEVNFSDDFERINDLIFGDLDQTVEIESTLVDFVAEADRKMEPTAPTPVLEVETPVEVEINTTNTAHSVEEVRSMSVTEKLALEPPFPCEECGTVFDIDDQRSMSVLSKHKAILCTPCYRAKQSKK